MTATPEVAAPRTGTQAEVQAVIAAARAHARRRRQKTGLAVALIAAAVGGGCAVTGAFSGNRPTAHSRPTAPSRPSQAAPLKLTAHTGEVTGYIAPCEPMSVGMPYAAGTVTALRGQVTSKPDGPNIYRILFPTSVAARQHVGVGQRFHFNLAPGQYVLLARYDHSSATSWLAVSIAAGRVLDRIIPDSCK